MQVHITSVCMQFTYSFTYILYIYHTLRSLSPSLSLPSCSANPPLAILVTNILCMEKWWDTQGTHTYVISILDYLIYIFIGWGRPSASSYGETQCPPWLLHKVYSHLHTAYTAADNTPSNNYIVGQFLSQSALVMNEANMKTEHTHKTTHNISSPTP